MIVDIRDKNITYNISYLVCVPVARIGYLPAIEKTFSNVCVFEPNLEFVQDLNFFCQRNQIRTIILVDYMMEYKDLILCAQDHRIIFYTYLTIELGSLSSQWYTDVLDGAISLYENNFISGISFIDQNMYNAFKNKIKSFYLPLDFCCKTSHLSSNQGNGIGILSDPMNPMHSFYNTLSAIRLGGNTANLAEITSTVKEFTDTFSVRFNRLQDKHEVLECSEVNTYINFTDNNYQYFFDSMEQGIPCILGNQQIIAPEDVLYDLITVKSDDDIIEIADKINYAKVHKKEIFNAYKKFKKKYLNLVEKCRKEFLPEFIPENESETDILLSVIVPIYNTETYLKDSVESIIRAKIPHMEILLIDDGSKDNSGQIARELQNDHPEFIRYIHQENHGLGNVRNVSLREAKGKYITSVDSDDSIDKKTFKESLRYLQSGTDMVIYDWLSIDVATNNSYVTSAKDGIGDRKNNFEDFLYASISPSACNKIIKKSLYDELGLEFLEAKYEDLSLNPLIIMKSKSIAYIRRPYYKYNLRQGSIMRNNQNGINFDMIMSLNMLNQRLLKIYGNYDNYDELYYYVFFWRIEDLVINRFYEKNFKASKNETEKFYDDFLPLFNRVYNTESVKKFFENLPNKTQKFFKERNAAIRKEQLQNYVKKMKCKPIKLSSADIYSFLDVE